MNTCKNSKRTRTLYPAWRSKEPEAPTIEELAVTLHYQIDDYEEDLEKDPKEEDP